MGIFPAYFKRITLEVNKHYLICNGTKIREVKFIRSSPKGFNFQDVNSKKNVFKRHLYTNDLHPEELTEATVTVIKNLIINEKPV